MGLSDRDYMRERRAPEQVFAPPEPTRKMTLKAILWFVSITYLSLKVFHWWDDSRRPPPQAYVAPAVEQPVPGSDLERRTRVSGNSDPHREVPTYQAVPQPPSGTTAVNKCVVNGRVTFSDSPCEAGASSTRVSVNGNQNTADGLPISTPARAASPVTRGEPPSPVELTQGPDPLVVRKAECDSHDQAIRSIDAQARQPLGPAQQDWLAGERKKHRDAQFRLRC